MARGLAENEKMLTRFFPSFPDYNVVGKATPAATTL